MKIINVDITKVFEFIMLVYLSIRGIIFNILFFIYVYNV